MGYFLYFNFSTLHFSSSFFPFTFLKARSPCHIFPPHAEADAVWDMCYDAYNMTGFLFGSFIDCLDNVVKSQASYNSQYFISGGSLSSVYIIHIVTDYFFQLLWSGNCSIGQLTTQGYKQAKQVGAALRRYLKIQTELSLPISLVFM
jgi:hypothetical protein